MTTNLSKTNQYCKFSRPRKFSRGIIAVFSLSNSVFSSISQVFAYSLDTVKNNQAKNEKINLCGIHKKITQAPSAVFEEIRKLSDELRAKDDSTANQVIKQKIRALKLKQPFFLFSGWQSAGHTKKQLEYNGVVQIDIDIKQANGAELAQVFKKKLSKLPFVALCAISPSSYGVKVLISTTNKDKSNHNQVAQLTEQLLSELCDIDLDLFDTLPCAQPCFLTLDKEAYINKNFNSLHIEINPPQPNKEKKDSIQAFSFADAEPSQTKELLIIPENTEPLPSLRINPKINFFSDVDHARPLGDRRESDEKLNEDTDKNLLEFLCNNFPTRPSLDPFYTLVVVLKNSKNQKTTKNPAQAVAQLAPSKNIKPLATVLIGRACESAIKTAQKRYNHRTQIITSFAGLCVSFGVEYDDALKFVTNNGSFEQKHLVSLRATYNKYLANFGSNQFKLFDTEQLPQAKHTLAPNQKLSNLDIDIKTSSRIIAPTGSGKSYFVYSLKSPRVIVVPTQGLVREFAEQYNATPFYAQASDVSIKDTFIATTYKSFERLCHILGETKKEYRVFVDEYHNNTSAGYIVSDLTKVMDNVQGFKTYHLLTATPLLSLHPLINKLRITNIAEREPVKKEFKFLYYKDSRFLAILEQVIKNKKEGIQTAILFNNTQNKIGKLHDLAQMLAPYDFRLINSTTKDSKDFFNIVVNGDMNGCDGIVCTTVLKEGNSIKKHASRVQCIIVGGFHPSTLEQFCARFRNVKKREMVIIKSIKKEQEQAVYLFKEQAKAEYSNQEQLKKHAQSFAQDTKIPKEARTDILKGYIQSHTSCLNFDESLNVSINLLEVSNLCHEQEKSAANKDSAFMSAYLTNQYGWKETKSKYFYGKESKLSKEQNKQEKKKNKAERRKLWLSIVNEYKENDLVEIPPTAPEKEKRLYREIQERIEYLKEFCAGKEQAISILVPSDSEPLDTKLRWKNKKQQIKIALAKSRIDMYGAKKECAQWINEVARNLKKYEVLSSSQATEIINQANKRISLKTVNSKKALKIIRAFCEIKPTTKKDNNKKAHYYKIISHDPTGLFFDIPLEFTYKDSSPNIMTDKEWNDIILFYGIEQE